MSMRQPELLIYHLGEGVRAFSSTRQGGYSEGSYGEFNINRYCGDSDEAIRRNREALCRLLGIADEHLLMPHQVHKAEIAVIEERLDEDLEGYDALMTNVPGVCIGVSTADCIPVLLYDQKKQAVCAVHAGWRGTVQRIVEKAIAKMADVYGSCPTDIVAQVGPGIHLDSFEVGDEVYDAFANEGFRMETISKRYEKWHIDLPECNRQQLLSAGIPNESITVSPICTYEQSDRFFSARRLGINSGRSFTGILLL